MPSWRGNGWFLTPQPARRRAPRAGVLRADPHRSRRDARLRSCRRPYEPPPRTVGSRSPAGRPAGASGREHRHFEVPGFVRTPRRRGWDSNPRSLAGHTISNRADSAALAPLPEPRRYRLAWSPGTAGPPSDGPRRARARAAAGFCATGPREPSQGREAAALSEPSRVPQGTWLLRTPSLDPRASRWP